MKTKNYNIKIPLYDIDINLLITHNPMCGKIFLQKKYSGVDFGISPNTIGYTSEVSNKNKGTAFIMMLVADKKTLDKDINPVIAHEALHISYSICDYIGLKVDSRNHEAQAYVLERVFQKVSEIKEIHIEQS